MIDVANEARVSQTTVSLVLNHADGARLSSRDASYTCHEGRCELGYQARAARRRDRIAAAASIGFIATRCRPIRGPRSRWMACATSVEARSDVRSEVTAATRHGKAVRGATDRAAMIGLIYGTMNTRRLARTADAVQIYRRVLLNCYVAPGTFALSVVPVR